MPAQSETSNASSTAPEFDENDHYFYFCEAKVHYKDTAVLCGLFGFLSVSAVFFLCMWKFAIWSRYEDLADLLTLIGFSLFLFSGTFVHTFIFVSVKKNDPTLLNPSLLFHAFLILIEIVMILNSIGELADDDVQRIADNDVLAKEILLVVPGLLACNILVLCFLLRYRYYLKQLHLSTAINGPIASVLYNQQEINECDEKVPIE